MEVEDIIDKYRSAKLQIRVLWLIFLGVLPGLYIWTENVDSLDLQKTQVEAQVNEERSKFESSRQKVAELPALLAKLNDIESELVKAKEILPDKIEVDEVLSALGQLEKEFDVKLAKFTPGQELQPDQQLEYREMPIVLELQGSFPQTMRFLDKLVHMPNLTHIRNVSFTQAQTMATEGNKTPSPLLLDSQARLILFRGI